MKRISLLLLALLSFSALHAVSFHGINDDAHISGPKLNEKDLEGRVIAVEIWGYQCPPCRASLPHMAKLAKSYEKDPRVVIIGSHCQDRNESGILSLLQKSGCEYPVYQGAGVDGAPPAGGIPFAYVVNHKGQFVWSGFPSSDFAGFEKAIANALKAVPKLPEGSLLVGLEINYCKDVMKRIVAGQNIESVLRQLETRVGRGGEAGKEAQMILDRCEAWANETEAAIRAAMEAFPSKAIAQAQVYTRTYPKRTAALKQELATLAKDPIVNKLAQSRAAYAKLIKTKTDSINAKRNLLSKAKLQLRNLATITLEEPSEDFKEIEALWKEFTSAIEASLK
jgi:thiol-disulfide isomerase/thioredoxin